MNFDVTSIGTWAGSLSILAWIVYIVFKCLVQESMKSKFAKELQNLKDANAKELEGFKAGYQKVLDENQIRFSGFYSEQSKAILELHQKLAELYIAMNVMTATVKSLPKDEAECEKYLDEEERKTGIAYNECMAYYLKVKLLLPESAWVICNKYLDKCRRAIDDYRFLREYPNHPNRDPANTYRAIAQEQLPVIEKQLQRCLIAILNGDDVPIAPAEEGSDDE